MWRTALGRIGIAVCLLVGLAGVSGAVADTGDPSSPLFRANGTMAGSASITGNQATVTLQGAAPNTTYTVCITHPLLQQRGACSSVSSLGVVGTVVAITCVTMPGMMGRVCMPSGQFAGAATCIPVRTRFGITCLPGGVTCRPFGGLCFIVPAGLFIPSFTLMVATGTITTDATGAGSVTITLPVVMPVSVVVVTNTADPGDTAQGVITGS